MTNTIYQFYTCLVSVASPPVSISYFYQFYFATFYSLTHHVLGDDIRDLQSLTQVHHYLLHAFYQQNALCYQSLITWLVISPYDDGSAQLCTHAYTSNAVRVKRIILNEVPTRTHISEFIRQRNIANCKHTYLSKCTHNILQLY